MDLNQSANYKLDKSRNKNNRTTKFYLWCYRTLHSKGCALSKIFAKFSMSFIWKARGIEIDAGSIGGGLRMSHLNGIFIHKNASLGENCTIFQQVTVGANEHNANRSSAPQIGNKVYIGAGAKVIGDISIGDNVRIGANAVVTRSVPANMTVVGYNRMIERKADDTLFL